MNTLATAAVAASIILANQELAEEAKKVLKKSSKGKPQRRLSEKERLEAAERYAAADKSDPFARARIRTHMANGVCGFHTDGRDAYYSADEDREMTEYGSRPTYRNRVRP